MRPSWSLLGPLLRLLPLLSLFFSGQVRKADADSREYICEFVELGSVSGPILTEIPNDRFPELGNGNGMKISIYGNSIPPVIQHLDGIRPNPDDPFIPVNLLAEFTGTPRPLALTALWSSVPTEGFEVDINSTGNDPVRFITARPYKGWFEGPWWKVTRVQSGAALALEKGKETETKWGRKGRKTSTDSSTSTGTTTEDGSETSTGPASWESKLPKEDWDHIRLHPEMALERFPEGETLKSDYFYGCTPCADFARDPERYPVKPIDPNVVADILGQTNNSKITFSECKERCAKLERLAAADNSSVPCKSFIFESDDFILPEDLYPPVLHNPVNLEDSNFEWLDSADDPENPLLQQPGGAGEDNQTIHWHHDTERAGLCMLYADHATQNDTMKSALRLNVSEMVRRNVTEFEEAEDLVGRERAKMCYRTVCMRELDESGAADPSICMPCPVNSYCAGGRESKTQENILAQPCHNFSDTSTSQRPFASVLSCQCEDAREFNEISLDQGGELCTQCSAGSFKNARSNDKCNSCGPNASSTVGTSSAAGCYCNPGTLRETLSSVPSSSNVGSLNSFLSGSCLTCPSGMYCPGGLVAAEEAKETDLMQVAGLSYYHYLVAPAAPAMNMTGFNISSTTSTPTKLASLLRPVSKGGAPRPNQPLKEGAMKTVPDRNPAGGARNLKGDRAASRKRRRNQRRLTSLDYDSLRTSYSGQSIRVGGQVCGDGAPVSDSGTQSEDSCQCVEGRSYSESTDGTSSVVCELCPAGLYKDLVLNGPCRGRCFSNGDTVPGAQTARQCYCKEGYYFQAGPDTATFWDKAQCKKCMTGAYCPGGFRAPVRARLQSDANFTDIAQEDHGLSKPLAGYFRISAEPEDVHQCPNPDSCDGGAVNSCSEGHTGVSRSILCGDCLPGYFRLLGGTQCQRCAENRYGPLVTGAFTSFVCILTCFGFGAAVIWSSRDVRDGLAPLIFCIVLNFVGSLTVLQHFNLDQILQSKMQSWSANFIGSLLSLNELNPFLAFNFDCLLRAPALDLGGDREIRASEEAFLPASDVFVFTQIFYVVLPFFLLLGVVAFSAFTLALFHLCNRRRVREQTIAYRSLCDVVWGPAKAAEMLSVDQKTTTPAAGTKGGGQNSRTAAGNDPSAGTVQQAQAEALRLEAFRRTARRRLRVQRAFGLFRWVYKTGSALEILHTFLEHVAPICVASLILLHNTVTAQLLQLLDCVQLANVQTLTGKDDAASTSAVTSGTTTVNEDQEGFAYELRMRYALDISCSSDRYAVFRMIAVFGTCVWTVGIPSFVFLLSFLKGKRQESLKSEAGDAKAKKAKALKKGMKKQVNAKKQAEAAAALRKEQAQGQTDRFAWSFLWNGYEERSILVVGTDNVLEKDRTDAFGRLLSLI
eukprot:Cvel_21804.t2-p1 / transcript=Cvel_21804.t2 / gene=Cvel_21804 / organism=Chromera_velia_CCMP2878 / gene_product=hypothetical protein / transcript_product=hypothetical protein / location=Cvel_scaffold2078:402-7982(-) / protein_length=1388 / sequence_SO=supercontig / SO=protein_coding / is_pseudo=false